jgi:hypothetical protein
VIDGHRDTNQTACPGRHLYAALPQIRRRAGRLVRRGGAPTAVVVDDPAVILGTATMGQVLRIDLGAYRPSDATVKVRWLRDGRPIPGARKQTYTCRPRDVGRRVSCRVVLVKDGLDPVTQTTTPTAVVGARAVMTADVTTKRRRAVVRVTVAAPDRVRPTPAGTVTIRVGERTRTARLTDGTARVAVGGHRRMPRGTFRLRVTYPGDGVFTARRVTGSVTIR